MMIHRCAGQEPAWYQHEQNFRLWHEEDIARSPNRHIAFGMGEHVCLGAHLARLEIRSLLEELTGRMESAELDGRVQRVRSSFVGGIKHVPLRWQVGEAR